VFHRLLNDHSIDLPERIKGGTGHIGPFVFSKTRHGRVDCQEHGQNAEAYENESDRTIPRVIQKMGREGDDNGTDGQQHARLLVSHHAQLHMMDTSLPQHLINMSAGLIYLHGNTTIFFMKFSRRIPRPVGGVIHFKGRYIRERHGYVKKIEAVEKMPPY